MKPFTFRLESVLKYRKFMEKKAMLRLMQKKKAREEIEMAINHLSVRQSDLATKCSQVGEKGTDAFLFQSYKSYLDTLRENIETAFGELKEKDHQIREQEAVLKKETTHKKALEKLRELGFEAHRGICEKMEQDYLDELVINQRGARV